jgi:hypothetical protein
MMQKDPRGLPNNDRRNANILLLAASGKFRIGDIATHEDVNAAVPTVELCLKSFKEEGIDGPFRNRPSLMPKGSLSKNDNLLWLIAGIEAGRVPQKYSAVQWLAVKGCKVTAAEATKHEIGWIKCKEGSLLMNIWSFLDQYTDMVPWGFADSPLVARAADQVRRFVDEIAKTPGL